MLVFGKYETTEVQIADPSLANYVTLETKKVPITFGRLTRRRSEKAQLSVVERLINKIMRSGQGKRKMSGKYIRGRNGCGKKIQAMRIVESAFDIVQKRTKEKARWCLIPIQTGLWRK